MRAPWPLVLVACASVGCVTPASQPDPAKGSASVSPSADAAPPVQPQPPRRDHAVATADATPPCEAMPTPAPGESLPRLHHLREPLAGTVGIKSIVSISADDNETCAVDCAGRSYCWDLINELDVRDPEFQPPPPVRVFEDESLVEIGVGSGHRCGRRADGAVICRGGWRQPTPGAVDVPPAHALELDSNNSCAMTEQGVFCWGENWEGSLGLGPTQNHPPTQLPERLTRVAVNHSHSCGVTSAGAVWCWGRNAFHALGCEQGQPGCGEPGPVHDHWPPVAGIPKASQVAVGGDHSCALTLAGEVFCWGNNSAGQSGGQQHASPWQPRKVQGLPQVAALALGYEHSCATTASGAVYCWGSNAFGQSGPMRRDEYRAPVHLEGLPAVRSLAIGAIHSCALTRDGRVLCWGIGLDPSD